ncbi:MAG: hypothetical protein OHK0039_08070 [Bacteroidia bacterium]
MNQQLWDTLFPYHIRIDPQLSVVGVGRSFCKLYTTETLVFGHSLRIKRPRLAAQTYDALRGICGQLALVEILRHNIYLRGQWVQEGSDLVFCGSPWLTDAAQMETLGLDIHDFALHDPIIDLLQLTRHHAMTIEDLRQQTAALTQAKQAAETALRAKRDFLSVMTHEIRTPLHAVIGMANQLLEEAPLPRQLESLHTLRFSGESLLSLVNDILDFSKLEAGKIELDHRPVNLRELLRNIYRLFWAWPGSRASTCAWSPTRLCPPGWSATRCA